MILDPRLPERLAWLLIPEPNSGCWLFNGRWETGNGYGKTTWEGRDVVLHRVIYTLLVGPIPPGHLLDHLCRVRCCCNPAHLEPVLPRVNTMRGYAVLFRRINEYDSDLPTWDQDSTY